jgi:hypothetical protein
VDLPLQAKVYRDRQKSRLGCQGVPLKAAAFELEYVEKSRRIDVRGVAYS